MGIILGEGNPLASKPPSPTQLTVATLNSKSLYRIKKLLNELNIPFQLLTPSSIANGSANVTFTTRGESPNSAKRVVYIDELAEDEGIAKAQVIAQLNHRPIRLLVGVDPGKRFGYIIYLHGTEIERGIKDSAEAILHRLKQFDDHLGCSFLIKIGMGDPFLGQKLATELSTSLRGSINIELVDERGTSNLGRGKLKGSGRRDERAARLIAFRKGEPYHRS